MALTSPPPQAISSCVMSGGVLIGLTSSDPTPISPLLIHYTGPTPVNCVVGTVVFRRGLLLPEIHHPVDLRLRRERAVHAEQPRRFRRQEQYVTLAQQMLRAYHVQHRA